MSGKNFQSAAFANSSYSLDALRIVSPPACLSVKRMLFGSPLRCMIGPQLVLIIFVENSELFWNFLKKVLIISHGNADVKRGFSINKEAIVENHLESLIAQRQKCGGVQEMGGVVCNIVDIPKAYFPVYVQEGLRQTTERGKIGKKLLTVRLIGRN
ncbi:Protein-arginine deiminase type-1 [Frankliniella fusca]|uniref:Protein-arginine deiminase type-1 n=1 Tax=Frankliniella fusca TaxID=407009 RepID=A0AAE1I0B5_9NEOP|nr:Protein-arginine deiminase type-1 [Frankliniella fusca]